MKTTAPHQRSARRRYRVRFAPATTENERTKSGRPATGSMNVNEKVRRGITGGIYLLRRLWACADLRFVLAAACLPCATEAVEWKVNGRLISHHIAAEKLWTNNFTVILSHCSFYFEVQGGNPLSPSVRAQDCLFDGAHLYSFTRFHTNLLRTEAVWIKDGIVETIPLKNPVASTNWADVTITSGPMLSTYESFELITVWLAFASHCRFLTNGSFSVRPLVFLGHGGAQDELVVKTDIVMHSGLPGFVSELTAHGPPYRLAKWGRVFSQEPKFLPDPSTDSLIYRYRALNWTSIEEDSIPKRFVFEVFTPSSGGKAGATVEGLVTDVEVKPSFSAEQTWRTPKLEPRTRVHEGRPEVTGISKRFTYMSPSGDILSRGELGQLQEYRHFISATGLERNPSYALPQPMLFLGLGILLASPLFLWWYRKTQN